MGFSTLATSSSAGSMTSLAVYKQYWEAAIPVLMNLMSPCNEILKATAYGRLKAQ